jgi:hypothetical protein
MNPPRLRLSTLILMIVIVALILALVIQDRRRRSEFDYKYSIMVYKLETQLLQRQSDLRTVVGRWQKERIAREALQKQLDAME